MEQIKNYLLFSYYSILLLVSIVSLVVRFLSLLIRPISQSYCTTFQIIDGQCTYTHATLKQTISC